MDMKKILAENKKPIHTYLVFGICKTLTVAKNDILTFHPSILGSTHTHDDGDDDDDDDDDDDGSGGNIGSFTI